mgnify:FL=1
MNSLIPADVAVIEKNENSIVLEFVLAPTLLWFKGHFPVQPILPQLDWVTRFARAYGLCERTVKNIRQIKFTVPMIPRDLIRLHLSFDEKYLSFTYKSFKNNEWITVSQGKVS